MTYHNIRKMTERERQKFSEFIESSFGIKMPASKKLLLQSRLHKRLQALQMNNYGDYFKYLMTPEGKELEMLRFIDLVSTHKTEFFRESKHWYHYIHDILPDIIRHHNRSLRIWSAACSTGQEVYTIAMATDDFFITHNLTGYNFVVFGTDISVDVLEKAYNAVYTADQIDPIPLALKKRYIMRSKKNKNDFRIKPSLRAHTRFRRLNLMDNQYGVTLPVDVVFCRNVLIYFNREKQQHIIKKLLSYIKSGGYLIIGHSESLAGFNLNAVNKFPTIYKKR